MSVQGAFERTKDYRRRLREEASATNISIFIQSIDDLTDTKEILEKLVSFLSTVDAKLVKIEYIDEKLPSGSRSITRKAFFSAPKKR